MNESKEMTVQDLLLKQKTLKTLTLKKVAIDKQIPELIQQSKQIETEIQSLRTELETLFPDSKDLFEYVVSSDRVTTETTQETTTGKRTRTSNFIHHFTVRKGLESGPLSRVDLFNKLKIDNLTLSQDHFDKSIDHYKKNGSMTEKAGKLSWVSKSK